MPNVNVFRGSDATLVLAVDNKDTEEGKLADGLITDFAQSRQPVEPGVLRHEPRRHD